MALRILLVIVKLGLNIAILPQLRFPAEYPYNIRMAKQKQPRKRLPIAVLRQMLTLATSGFGLVAALAWNNVIQELVDTQIKPYLPMGSGLLSLGIYAIVVTILAVTVTVNLSRLIERLEK
jgi:hypothetical protein